jgi:hypothetical protein
MYLICLYLLVLIIVIFFVVMSKKEGFQTMFPSVSVEANTTTSVSNEGMVNLNSPMQTESNLNNMDEIYLDNLEKNNRDEQSSRLNSCLGKYVNRPVRAFRDVGEIMNSKPSDCVNIYDYTTVSDDRFYFDQSNYW